jgi:glucose-6-phosphate isomerase
VKAKVLSRFTARSARQASGVRSVKKACWCLEVSVALMGEHYDVNAFDQPGVEAGKLAAYALMGRAGHEQRRAEIEAARGGEPRVV